MLLACLAWRWKALFSVRNKDRLVAGILVIGVVLEAVVSVHDGVLEPAANWESVTHYSPLQNTHTHTQVYTCQELCRALDLQTDHQDSKAWPLTPWHAPILPVARSKWPLLSQHHEWGPPTGTSLDREQGLFCYQACVCYSSACLHGYLCLGALGGCPRPSGRRGRSWGSPHRGQTRPPAGLKSWWRPSSPSECACSRSTQRAAERVRCVSWKSRSADEAFSINRKSWENVLIL